MDVDLLLEVDATYAMEAAGHPAVRGGSTLGNERNIVRLCSYALVA
jgi:hypothetical protein